MREAARAVTSLDKPIGDESDSSLGDLVATTSADVRGGGRTSSLDRGGAPPRASPTLPEREQHVLKLRYGLDGDQEPTSLEEIGRQLGLTRERVRQIEAQALERLAVNREIEALREAA